jgi:hypothetical protein
MRRLAQLLRLNILPAGYICPPVMLRCGFGEKAPAAGQSRTVTSGVENIGAPNRGAHRMMGQAPPGYDRELATRGCGGDGINVAVIHTLNAQIDRLRRGSGETRRI